MLLHAGRGVMQLASIYGFTHCAIEVPSYGNAQRPVLLSTDEMRPLEHECFLGDETRRLCIYDFHFFYSGN